MFGLKLPLDDLKIWGGDWSAVQDISGREVQMAVFAPYVLSTESRRRHPPSLPGFKRQTSDTKYSSLGRCNMSLMTCAHPHFSRNEFSPMGKKDHLSKKKEGAQEKRGGTAYFLSPRGIFSLRGRIRKLINARKRGGMAVRVVALFSGIAIVRYVSPPPPTS